MLAILAAPSPVSPIKADTGYYNPPEQPPSAIDTKWYVYREGAALASYDGKHPLPNNKCLKAGERFAKQHQKVQVGGVNGGSAIGFFAYGAGSEKHIIDYLALTDPLLAKLPAKNSGRLSAWSSGHFLRLIPEGYVETALGSTNKIADPALHEFYDKVLNITRGPIFSWGRIGDIVKMNTGQYDYLLEEYDANTKGKKFRQVIQKWRGPVG